MASVPDESTMLSAARPLVAAGIAVHWLHRRDKRPVGDDWQKAPIHTMESLKAAYKSGFNIGVRPGEFSKTAIGYLHLVDLDIRRLDLAHEAWAALLKVWPEAKSFPSVISGSGGESRHIYFFTDKHFRSHKFARSAGFSMVFDAKKGRDVKKFDWEVELFGAPKQAVLPPSLHPDTGEPYTWERPLDLSMVELGMGPTVDSSRVETWGAAQADLDVDDDDDLLSIARNQPMGLTEEEIDRTLDDLPPEWVDDRDLWLQVGAALHHEYEGRGEGLLRWNDWSRPSPKFDEDDQKRVWKSFKGARKPVRMATLIKAAGDHRMQRDHSDLDALMGETDDVIEGTAVEVIDDLADLLGDSPAPDLDVLLGEPQTNAPGADGPDDPEWRQRLDRNEEGVLKPTLHNLELIIRNDARTRRVMAFNEFTQEVVQINLPRAFGIRKPGPKPIKQLDGPIWGLKDRINGDLWSDSHDHAIRAILEAPTRQGGYGIKVSDRDLRGAVDIVAHENAFHPIRDFLKRITWDGVPRVEGLFIDYLGAVDNSYHKAVARLTMLGAVTRIFEPGHKFDFVPILEGVQGKRKSTFIEKLAMNWFAELEGDFHDRKAMVEKMQGSWILELPELDSFARSEVTTIKAFVSARFDKVRMAYARRAQVFMRQCIFFGSTNNDDYLKDMTGGRRFWPVECLAAEIDTDRLAANVEQMWAEAVVMYRELRASGVHTLPLYLADPETKGEAARLQESRRMETAEEMMAGGIHEWLSSPITDSLGLDEIDDYGQPIYRAETCVSQIWIEMLGKDPANLDQRNSVLIGKAMKHVPGWFRGPPKRLAKYGLQRVFLRTADAPVEDLL